MSLIEVHPTPPPTENRHVLTAIEGQAIVNIAQSLGYPEMEEYRLAPHLLNDYQEAFKNSQELSELRQEISDSLADRADARGYLHITGMPAVDRATQDKITTLFAVALGTPVQVYGKASFIKELGTDLKKDKHKSSGIGHNPFHVDAVNTENPPHFVVFTGIRKDPAGGAFSNVSSIQQAVSGLSGRERELLQQPLFSYGEYYDVHNVGKELKPFPALILGDDGLWQLRYTEKGMAEGANEETLHALENLGQLLEDGKERLQIKAGDIVLLNQRLVVHGKEEHGPGQENIPEGERRLITQVFVQT